MDVSCGIAVAHKKYPLQHIINEARLAEHRAKNEYARAAFSMSLMKRSGETIEWGAKWDEKVWDLYRYYTEERRKGTKSKISARFPYALAALLAPYSLNDAQYDNGKIMKLIAKELDHVLRQQVADDNVRSALADRSKAYLDILKAANDKEDFLKLYLAAAFIERDRQGGHNE